MDIFSKDTNFDAMTPFYMEYDNLDLDENNKDVEDIKFELADNLVHSELFGSADMTKNGENSSSNTLPQNSSSSPDETIQNSTSNAANSGCKRQRKRKSKDTDEQKEKNRIRAQLTRKRKKDYYSDLETKNKLLEAENKKLKSIIEEFKHKEYQNVLGSDTNAQLHEIYNSFHLEEDSEDQAKVTESRVFMLNYLKNNGPNGVNRSQAISTAFQLIIDQLIPDELKPIIDGIDTKLNLDWNELSKIPKMLRYHWNHYKKVNNVSQFEELVAHMGLKKRQHKLFISEFQSRVSMIKQKYQEGLANLMASQGKLQKASEELQSYLKSCFADDIFSEYQIVRMMSHFVKHKQEYEVSSDQTNCLRNIKGNDAVSH